MMIGKIVAIDTVNGLSVLIDGEETPTEKKYKYLSSYAPKLGDRVIIQKIADSYIILGNIIP